MKDLNRALRSDPFPGRRFSQVEGKASIGWSAADTQ